MAGTFHIDRISDALRDRRFPAVTVWNRLEGRPRTEQFDRALRAEVRDALWMLTRQWQLGELHGDDAGSPFFARLHLSTTRLTKYRPRELAPEPYRGDVPLEATVERRPVQLVRAGREIALDLRLIMGRQWLKMTAAVGHGQAFIDHYPIELPAAPGPGDEDRFAHPDAWQTLAAVAGRRMDGGQLYLHLTANPANRPYDGIGGISHEDQTRLDEHAGRFVAWFERLILQPAAEESAWAPESLEYRFACSAPVGDGEEVFVAPEYAQGRLDWYSLDVDAASRGLGSVAGADGAADVTAAQGEITQTLIPTPAAFDGMPNTRWWAFEEGRTNFGAIDAATTDLAKLLFVEFGLVYANDWFVIPATLQTGTNARVRGLAVTTVFGERFWIEAVGSGAGDDWQRWTMYTLSTAGPGVTPADTGLLLLPTVPKVQEGPAVEDVLFARDEMANMVWGVERVVQLATGQSVRGSEAADETRRFHEAHAAGPPHTPPPPAADARYRVMTSVPENWIPFIPARVEDSTREIQLQRAAMPRIIEGVGGRPPKIQPQTSILREGLDRPGDHRYFIHEEEVPRTGVSVSQSFQRTRWRGGRVVVWLGARKRVARGESSSGLAFDQLADMPRSR
jgi:hypothetical protein